MGFAIETSTEFGAKTVRRVDDETLAWLTTVESIGMPQPYPVWFLWNNGSFNFINRPNQAKLVNIARIDRVSFNFEATPDEEQVTIFTGHAENVERATCGTGRNPTPPRIWVRRTNYDNGTLASVVD